MKSLTKNIIIAFVVFLVVAGVFSLLNTPESKAKISLSELANNVNQEQVESIEVSRSTITAVLKDGETIETQKEDVASITDSLINLGVSTEKIQKVDIVVKDLAGFNLVVGTLLPILLPFLLIGGFLFFTLRGAQNINRRASSFGNMKSSDKDADKGKVKGKKTTFKDVAGAREAKEELTEIVEFLKNPTKFTRLGAKIPRGVLLFGPPGVGKTMLARAVAGEAGAPFFYISASEFVELFVGVGASRVRDLFNKAKRVAPAIVFIDEIDAVGRQRGAGLGGSHDEREQTLNQILVELDGFNNKENVIVMAATNRPDVLDPALLRPGRFDRQVVLNLPDIDEREAILRVHAKNKPMVANTDLRSIAQRTPGFSGADLANVLNESAILAARAEQKAVSQSFLVEAIEKVMLGPERKSHILSDKERKITAYHEAGHALLAHLLPLADPVHKVSIISRGQAAGYTLKLPIEDKQMHSKKEFLDDLCVLLAGFLTERKIFKDITTGASNDLQRATKLARDIVTRYGMSQKLGPMTFGEKEEAVFLGRDFREHRNYSEEVAGLIDEEIRGFIGRAKKKTRRILKENKDKLDLIAETLMKRETLEKTEFEELMETGKITEAEIKPASKPKVKAKPNFNPKAKSASSVA